MKKVYCVLLSLLMLLALSTGASAATVVNPGSSEVGTVSVAVTGLGGGTEITYYVVMDWEPLTFTYNFAESSRVWDPEEHSYSSSGGGTAGWVDTDANITVTNHSNIDLDVAMQFEGGGTTKTVNDVRATLSNPSFSLESGEGKTFATADKDVTTVSVENRPSMRRGFEIGKIIVTIST